MNNKLIFSMAAVGLLFISCLFFPGEGSLAGGFPDPEKIAYPALEIRLPRAEKIELQNGMTLFYLPDHELPLVSISALLRAGTMYDPPGKEGVAELTATVMVTGGTKKIKSVEMDQRLDQLAATPSLSMFLDHGSVHFSFFKQDIAESLDLFAQILKEPAFEQERFELGLSLKKADLLRIADNPQRLAFREFNRLLYPDDPRGRYATAASLHNISRKDLVEYHEKYFFPSNILVTVSGDITREETLRLIGHYLGSWKDARSAIPLLAPPQASAKGVFVMKKELPQSVVVTGELTISKNHPDYYAFLVLDFIAGSGGFPSRIFTAVRNKEGLAYSAGSFYRARGDYGVFGTYAFTKTSSTYDALTLIQSILLDISTAGISNSELDWAKKSILNSFIFSFEHPSQIAEQQMIHAFDRLPGDYLLLYRDRINAVTVDDVKRVAKQYLQENKRLTVILGNADQFGKRPDHMTDPVFLSTP